MIDGPDGDDAEPAAESDFRGALPASPLDAASSGAVLDPARALVTLVRSALARAGRSALPRPLPAAPSASATAPIIRDGLGLAAGAVGRWRITACMATPRRRRRCSTPIADHLADAGLGQLSEIFDGDPPHAPRGARRRPGRSPACSKRGGGWSAQSAKPRKMGKRSQ